MRLEQLQYLVDVADTHSITRTAQNFFITQQACSNSLKQLENEMNAIFLIRLPSGVELTEQGKEMVAFAQRVLEDLRQTKMQLSFMQKTPRSPEAAQNIRICSNSIISTVLMPNIVGLFARQEKAITINITELGFDKMFEALLTGEYDLAFVAINRADFLTQLDHYRSSSLSHTILQYDETIACMHRQSPYAQQIAFANDEILHHIPHTIFSISPTDEYKANNFFDSVLCSNDIAFHTNLLLQKQVVTLMSQTTYRHLFKDRRLVTRPIHYPADYDPTIVHALVYRTPLTPTCAELVALIEKYSHLL